LLYKDKNIAFTFALKIILLIFCYSCEHNIDIYKVVSDNIFVNI
jgi:hypothetical protein